MKITLPQSNTVVGQIRTIGDVPTRTDVKIRDCSFPIKDFIIDADTLQCTLTDSKATVTVKELYFENDNLIVISDTGEHVVYTGVSITSKSDVSYEDADNALVKVSEVLMDEYERSHPHD